MRFATWNVNSLKVRQERLEQWLADVSPDVVCMQETKLADDAFPQLDVRGARLRAAHHGEGRWNGVAMLSRSGLDDVSFGFADGDEPDAEARLMTACGRRHLDHQRLRARTAGRSTPTTTSTSCAGSIGSPPTGRRRRPTARR